MAVDIAKTLNIEARINELRDSLGEALRSRVVGPDAETRVQQIMEVDGPRWYADDRPIRIVHADASMFIGGLRALLLQTLHPLAMAGVAQHSDYKSDPWGRLQRTADFLAATTFGPADEAQRIIDRILACAWFRSRNCQRWSTLFSQRPTSASLGACC
jgi:hypothetical protein